MKLTEKCIQNLEKLEDCVCLELGSNEVVTIKYYTSDRFGTLTFRGTWYRITKVKLSNDDEYDLKITAERSDDEILITSVFKLVAFKRLSKANLQ